MEGMEGPLPESFLSLSLSLSSLPGSLLYVKGGEGEECWLARSVDGTGRGKEGKKERGSVQDSPNTVRIVSRNKLMFLMFVFSHYFLRRL